MFQILPEDAHRRVSKALHISITDVYTGQNKVISSYATRAELIDVSWELVVWFEPISGDNSDCVWWRLLPFKPSYFFWSILITFFGVAKSFAKYWL